MPTSPQELAHEYFTQAFEWQMKGELEGAVAFYGESIAAHETAQAHTFLGWTYSLMGDLDRAMAECQRAITLDPAYSNAYNDLGAYLMERGRCEEAEAWLNRALAAPGGDGHYNACMNLAGLYRLQGKRSQAKALYQKALTLRPGDALARQALQALDDH